MKKKLIIIIVFSVFLFVQPINAQTWEKTKRLSWTLGGSYAPDSAVDTKNHIHVVWQDDTPGKDEIYYKKSTNGGTSWTTKRLTWTPDNSWWPAIAVDSNDYIHVVWQDYTQNNFEIFFKRSTD